MKPLAQLMRKENKFTAFVSIHERFSKIITLSKLLAIIRNFQVQNLRKFGLFANMSVDLNWGLQYVSNRFSYFKWCKQSEYIYWQNDIRKKIWATLRHFNFLIRTEKKLVQQLIISALSIYPEEFNPEISQSRLNLLSYVNNSIL